MRTPREVLELAAALKKENPARSAGQVQRILKAQSGWAPDERTIQRMSIRTALVTAEATPVFGRFEASRPNERLAIFGRDLNVHKLTTKDR
jgi:putative transposase